MIDIKFSLFSFNCTISRDLHFHLADSSKQGEEFSFTKTAQLLERNIGKFDYVEAKFNEHYQAYRSQMAIYRDIPDTDFSARVAQFFVVCDELLQMVQYAQDTIPINQEFCQLQHNIISSLFAK